MWRPNRARARRPIERRVIPAPSGERKTTVAPGTDSGDAQSLASSRPMPKVSFVVTVYNKAAVLPFVVAGLAAQEGDFAREFIFVDDGSSDGSAAKLRELTGGWENVSILKQANAGPAVALNVGLRQARGDYIKPVDGDDLLLPWATRRLIEAIEATGCDVAFSPQNLAPASAALSYDLGSRPADALAAHRHAPGRIERCDDILRRSLHRAQTNPTTWLARAETVRRSGGCDERVFIQDYSIELRLAAQGSFALLHEPVYVGPAISPERLSGNEAQILHDVNLALANFIADRPNLPRDLARLGFVRAATRAWAWARRRGGKSMASREFWLICGARLGFLPPSPNLRATCRAFTATNAIRIPATPGMMPADP
jgi:glycosyltransferase involved in cell wall biosynthesis